MPQVGDQGGSVGLSGGAVAGIIITLLILLGVGAALAVLIIVIYMQRKQIGFMRRKSSDRNFPQCELI